MFLTKEKAPENACGFCEVTLSSGGLVCEFLELGWFLRVGFPL